MSEYKEIVVGAIVKVCTKGPDGGKICRVIGFKTESWRSVQTHIELIDPEDKFQNGRTTRWISYKVLLCLDEGKKLIPYTDEEILSGLSSYTK